MPNPFTMPLRTLNDGAYVQARTWESEYSVKPDFIDPVVNSPLAYHGTVGERFIGDPELPGYVRQGVQEQQANPGQPEPLSNLAPAPGSENLIAPRNAGEIGGTNRLVRFHGPVDAHAPVWSGKNTALRKPVVGNKGPVSGAAVDGATLASQAYFAQQAAYFSQQASDAAMVSAF